MEFKIKFTEQCLEDIENVCEYIATKLKEINASKNLRIKIMKATENLIKNPKMYVQIDKSDRLKRRYRKIVIDNYILLYTIDNEEKVIYISHLYYTRKNYLQGLI